MDVNSTPSSTASTASQKTTSTTANSSDSAASNALTGDFNTFIQLLTAQMNNQDPLEPTKNTEFVAQLASFSAVEQQILTNETLSAMAGKLGLGQAGEAATWIGKEALVEGGYAAFSGAPVQVEVEPVENAQSAVLVVRDQNGTIVTREAVDKSATTLAWSGTDRNGQPAEYGYYTFQVEASGDGEVIAAQRGKVFSPIEEVRLGVDGATLVAAGGVKLGTDDVTAIR